MRVKLRTIDWIIEILGFICIVWIVYLTIHYYNDLPDWIPKHFNGKGLPDQFGSRANILLTPIITIILYIGLSIMSIYISKQYIKIIKEYNLSELQIKVYNELITSVSGFKVLFTALYLHNTYEHIQISMKKIHEINLYTTYIFLLIVFTWTIYLVIKWKKYDMPRNY